MSSKATVPRSSRLDLGSLHATAINVPISTEFIGQLDSPQKVEVRAQGMLLRARVTGSGGTGLSSVNHFGSQCCFVRF